MADEPNTAISPKTTDKGTGPRKRRHRRRRTGTVVSDRGDKTITVAVDYLVRHEKYGKFMRRRTKLHAHDEANEAKVGDMVEVAECRPISKTKNWRLVRVIKAVAG
ncbi:MAG: 30S ribosomal protein S17 [Phycisphaerae bacterium]|nr:30S ribosomal protein S17 [Phycisphaerae bacterium]